MSDDDRQGADDSAAGLSLREVLATEDEENEVAARHYSADDLDDDDGPTDALPSTIIPYLKPDEHRVIATQQHWVRLIAPGIAFVGGLVAAIAANALLYADHHAAAWPVHLIWILWLAAAAWSGIKYAEWRQQWFVITGHRLILIYGVLSRHVDMLPISKLRDVHFDQSWTGQRFGYASFTCDSIATEGALNTIAYLPHPEYLYREICVLVMPPDDKPGPRGGVRTRGSRTRR